ncbi:MAG: hypothetical protein ACLQPD_02715 [Desulfomonilaceae bacterium]
MKEIGAGPHHRVEVDTAKNRMYLTFFGDALSDAAAAGLQDGVQAEIAILKPGFTALGDFTEMNLLGLPDIVQQLQATFLNAGVRKAASVWSHESFAKVLVDSSAQKVKSGEYSDRRKVFKNRVEAEAWLDE